MTTVRIAYAESRAYKTHISHVLVILADDAGGRALPLWLKGQDGHSFRLLLDRLPGGDRLPGSDRMPGGRWPESRRNSPTSCWAGRGSP